MDEVKQWQSQPLNTVYHPVIYLDCIHVKARVPRDIRELGSAAHERAQHKSL